jgi:hypothetical protein
MGFEFYEFRMKHIRTKMFERAKATGSVTIA